MFFPNEDVDTAVGVLMEKIRIAQSTDETLRSLRELIVNGAKRDPNGPDMYLQYRRQFCGCIEIEEVLDAWENVVKACRSLEATRTYFTLYYREEQYDVAT